MLNCHIIAANVKKAYELNKVFDLNNQNILYHVERVASKFDWGAKEWIVAYLHDVIEDNVMTFGEVSKLLFDSSNSINEDLEDICDILINVNAITKRKETYDEYIKRIEKYKIAKNVKLADLYDNCFRPLNKNITNNDVKRINKYLESIMYLQGSIIKDKIHELDK